MPRYAIIGSNCFTGSHLIDTLLENPENEVLGISRSPEYAELFLPYRRHPSAKFSFKQVDAVKKFELLKQTLDEFQPEIVVYVAALSEVALSNFQPLDYYDVNVKAVVQLCDFLKDQTYFEKYVHVSSAEIFGSCSGLLDESAPFYPSTPYAVSKAAADLHLETLRKNFNFPAIIVRSTNVYGKHQQLFKIIPRVIIRVKQGETIELHGGGTAKKSFIHIRDVVRGIIQAIDRGEPLTYHFSQASDQTVADIVRLVCERMEVKFEDVTKMVGERLGQDAVYQLDCRRAQEMLGWEPREKMESAIDETIDWIEQHWEEIQKLPHDYIHRV